MALIRFEPFRELATLESDMGHIMDQLWGGGSGTGNGDTSGKWVPAFDVRETDDAILLTLDLPGLDRNQIAIEVDDGRLTISGERSRETKDAGGRFHRHERRFGTFARSVTLPQGVDEGEIEAAYVDGVLEVRVPKPDESKPKRISIAGSDVVEGSGNEKK